MALGHPLWAAKLYPHLPTALGHFLLPVPGGQGYYSCFARRKLKLGEAEHLSTVSKLEGGRARISFLPGTVEAWKQDARG